MNPISDAWVETKFFCVMKCMPIVGVNWGESSTRPWPDIRTDRTDSGRLMEVPELPDPKSVKSLPRQSRECTIFTRLSVRTEFTRLLSFKLDFRQKTLI